MKLNELTSSTQKTLYVPIGTSGSGKSTYFRKLHRKNPDLLSFSLDDLRHEWYDPTNYARAWKMSTEDRTFSQKANKRFVDLLSTGKDLYIDNTNLTPKRRRFYLQLAKKKGYKTVAIVFDVDIDTLLARQQTREDKTVPEEAVRRQVTAFTRPLVGEFDEVIEIE